jgi:uncharacterized protein YggE
VGGDDEQGAGAVPGGGGGGERVVAPISRIINPDGGVEALQGKDAITLVGENRMIHRILAVLLLSSVAGGAFAQVNALPPTRHILVYGEAQARAIPDRFKIEVKFSVLDAKADVARAKVEDHLQDTISKLKQASVPNSEIVATSLQIEPESEYDQEQRKQVYKGIRVMRNLSARFADQAGLRKFLAALVTSQEVQVSGVSTELSSEPALKRQLRQKAIESTREKAEVIAKSYGVRLTGLYSVSDTAPQFSYGITEGAWPMMYQWSGGGTLDRIEVTGSAVADAGAVPESFQTGYVQFQDKVYAVFLIAD